MTRVRAIDTSRNLRSGSLFAMVAPSFVPATKPATKPATRPATPLEPGSPSGFYFDVFSHENWTNYLLNLHEIFTPVGFQSEKFKKVGVCGRLYAAFLFHWLVPNLSEFADQVVVSHSSASRFTVGRYDIPFSISA
jgi:hypothetical protein